MSAELVPPSSTSPRREVVLVGGGHAHVQVLRQLAMEPLPGTHLTVVVDTPIAVYSGMVPGFVAGQYRAEELEIDVLPLARRAGARVVMSRAVSVDADRRRIEVEGRPPVPYDLASFDIGSTVAGLDLPGVREHALPTRPITALVRRVEEVVERARDHDRSSPYRVVVVGGGAGGIEIAFTLGERLRKVGVEPRTTIVHGGARIVEGYNDRLRRRLRQRAAARAIEILVERKVVAVEPGRARLGDGGELPFDALLWVTGAVSYPVFEPSGLPTDHRGFVLVRPTLQVEGYDDLFAVGDCATLVEHPGTPKAGVYAVRKGPYLVHNLRAVLAGRGLRTYRPQSDFLTLLNLGDGTALGAKWGLAFFGRWVMRLKDRIDRKFMRRFQILDERGDLHEAFRQDSAGGSTMEAGKVAMVCGGCAAKVGRTALVRALDRLPRGGHPEVVLGLDAADDAAAYRLPGGDLAVASLDAFTAFTDDPYLVGRVAAINALSDLYAKGVPPRHAMALVAVPEGLGERESEELLYQLLAGVRDALDPLGVSLLGGHSTTAPGLLAGLSVVGVAGAEPLLTLDRLRPGQRLVLTKPLGTGVLFRADMLGRARGPWVQAALRSMLRANTGAAEVASVVEATAATDVSGFGVAGHLAEMARQSGVTAVVELGSLPALPGALELLERGVRSTFHPENEKAAPALEMAPEAAVSPRGALLFDPQTAGGLLFGVAPERSAEAVERLQRGGDEMAAVVGRVETVRGGVQVVVE